MNKGINTLEEISLWDSFRLHDDENAFTLLSQRYYRTLVHYGSKFTSNSPVIEDSIQEILIRLWLTRKSISSTSSVKYYLLKSFRHQLFVNFRKKNRFISMEDLSFDEPLETSNEELYIQHETNQIFSTQVKNLINTLPPRQREIIYLRFYQNLSLEEISQLLSINHQSVANSIQRAFQKLRRNWPDSYSRNVSVMLLLHECFK